MASYLTRDELLGALTGVHERTITPALFAGRAVCIREITARQRLMAQQAASADNPDAPDNALYRAMLIQMSVVDPESGDPADPRTRAPLLTLADVETIADGRDLLIDELVTEIAQLAALGPRAMFSGDPPADGPQRDPRAGAATRPAATARAKGQGTRNPDQRTAMAAEPAGGPGNDHGHVE